MANETAVRQADDRFCAALNAMFVGDLEPMKDLWSHADDVVYMGPARVLLVGWPAILADWEKQAALQLGGEIHIAERHMTVGQDLAAVYDRAEGFNTDAEGNRLAIDLRGTNVYRQEDGHWKMIAHHSDPLPYLKY